MKLGVIKHHLKVFLKFIQFSFLTQTAFRFNFFMGYLIDFGWLIFMFLFFKIFYLNLDEIAGWNYPQILVLLGTFQIYTSFIYGFFIIHHLRRLPRWIWNGELDFFLLKP